MSQGTSATVSPMCLSDTIIAAVVAKLSARRGELDAMAFGEVNISFEVKDRAPVVMRVMVEEKMTKTDILSVVMHEGNN